MSTRTAIGNEVPLLGLTKCICIIAGVRKIIEAYVVSENTKLIMILGRSSSATFLSQTSTPAVGRDTARDK